MLLRSTFIMTASDQLEGSRGQCGLGEAPPRDTRMIGTGFRSTVGVNPRSQEFSIRHALKDSTQGIRSLTDVALGHSR
jgi:hypothetical protein